MAQAGMSIGRGQSEEAFALLVVLVGLANNRDVYSILQQVSNHDLNIS